MKLFKNKPVVIAAAAVLLLVVLALATRGERTVTWVEGAVGSVAQPVQSFAAKTSNGIINFFRRLFNTTDADLENEQLRLYVAQLEQEKAELAAVAQENERLRALLNYAELEEGTAVVTAPVIGSAPGVWFDTFTIGAGRNHGVAVDQPVVCAAGLVGRVTSVAGTWAKVTALIDSSFSVSVMVQRTRDNCMVRGVLTTDAAGMLELYYLPSGSDLVPGDVIVTNGYGGIYPKGVTVGTVTEVTRQAASETGANALVKPAADFLRLEEVLVITSVAQQEEP